MPAIQQDADFLQTGTVTHAAIDWTLNAKTGAYWRVADYIVQAYTSPTSDVVATLVETDPQGNVATKWTDAIPASTPAGPGLRIAKPSNIPLRFVEGAKVEFKVTDGGTGIKVSASLAAYNSDGE